MWGDLVQSYTVVCLDCKIAKTVYREKDMRRHEAETKLKLMGWRRTEEKKWVCSACAESLHLTSGR